MNYGVLILVLDTKMDEILGIAEFLLLALHFNLEFESTLGSNPRLKS